MEWILCEEAASMLKLVQDSVYNLDDLEIFHTIVICLLEEQTNYR